MIVIICLKPQNLYISLFYGAACNLRGYSYRLVAWRAAQIALF